MLFELQITVDPRTNLMVWGEWCLEQGVKPLEIHLANQKAEHPTQLMFAATFESTDSEAFMWMDNLLIAASKSEYKYEHLDYRFFAPIDDAHRKEGVDYRPRTDDVSPPPSKGFRILRAKLEVPLDKSAKYTNAPYHECHVKSLIDKDDAPTLIKFAESLGWAASTNVLYPEIDGLQKWYFTRRTFGTNYLESAKVFKQAFENLPTEAFNAVRMESEAVVYDTNSGLDEGRV